jgi:hypothetical protein
MTNLTYDEIQSKTIKWCKSLLDNNIYSIEDYNKCIDSFSRDTGAIVPNKMEVPRTGQEHNYGLYNRDNKYLKESSQSNVQNRMMITSHDGKYLATDNNGKLYHIGNYNDQGINQSELEWAFISHGDGKFSIMSVAYQKYLSSNAHHIVTATSNDMDVSTIWKFKKLDEKTLLESSILSGYYVDYNDKEEYCVKITKGMADEKMWNFYPVNDNDDIIPKFDETEYKNKRIILFDNYVKKKQLAKILKAEIEILQELLNLVNNIFSNLKVNIDTVYIESRKGFNQKTAKYLRELTEIDEYRHKLSNANVTHSLFDSYAEKMEELEKKIGMKGNVYLSMANKKILEHELDKQKRKNDAMIMSEIRKRAKMIMENNELSDAEDKLDNFIMIMKGEVNNVDEQLNQNNKIMSKQINQINDENNKMYSKKTKTNRFEKDVDIVNFNSEVVDSRQQVLKKKRIYLIITIIMLLLVILGISYYIYYNIKDIYYS